MFKPAALLITLTLASVSAVAVAPARKAKKKRKPAMEVNPKDAKNTDSGKPLPPADPALAKFSMDEESDPATSAVTAAVNHTH